MIRAGKLQIPDGDTYFTRVFTRTGDRFQYELLRAAMSLCREKRVAVDVGAHVGSWARALEQHFEAVLAFEPEPANFRCLRANTTRTLAFNVALGDAPGEAGIAKHGANSGCWNLTPGNDIRIETLDSFNLEALDLLKLDVEGYEGRVLTGALETIRRCLPVIVFEDNGLGPNLFGAQWVDPKPVLRELGYRQRLRLAKDEIWLSR